MQNTGIRKLYKYMNCNYRDKTVAKKHFKTWKKTTGLICTYLLLTRWDIFSIYIRDRIHFIMDNVINELLMPGINSLVGLLHHWDLCKTPFHINVHIISYKNLNH